MPSFQRVLQRVFRDTLLHNDVQKKSFQDMSQWNCITVRAKTTAVRALTGSMRCSVVVCTRSAQDGIVNFGCVISPRSRRLIVNFLNESMSSSVSV